MEALLIPWNALLVHPLINLLVLAYGFARDFGLAIVLVTVAIRLVFYPLFVQQIRSQRVMQELGPAMNQLREKYGKDRQRLTEEQMKLYRERNYNPAMGCLPLLVQLPILFAFYHALVQFSCGLGQVDLSKCVGTLTSEQFETIRYPFVSNPIGGGVDLSARWLPWITDLGKVDPLYILPILAGVTQLISSVMAMPANQPKSADPQTRMMQSMAYYFPAITIFIAVGLPAGLSLYWVATTVFQIAQQYVVTGWGQLARWLPFLRAIPSPADRQLRRRQEAAVIEAEADMRAKGARAPNGPERQNASSGGGEAVGNRRRNRRRNRR